MSLAAGATVWTAERRALRLGKLLKSGGAGSIYPVLESPTQVAKIYHDSADRAEYERKVIAMLDLSPHLPDLEDGGRRFAQIAWPQALLRDERGRFVGFTMPLIDWQATSELECILQERQARAERLPTGLGTKVTLAANLAAVIAELHRQGHHVVDLKPVNLRFYRQTLYMAMLDCDGFSIQGRGERFAAQQITPDYLAPEFQDQPIPAALEEQQDRFALAVVIFQLLNFGIHPFTGRPTGDNVPTDIPGRIARCCYAYGLRANANLQPSPVSGHAAMPADLRALFDRAFAGAGAARPSAAEWASTLRAYAQRSSQRLVACAKDHEHQHYAGLACAACARVALIASTARNAASVKRGLSMPQAVLTKIAARATGFQVPHRGTTWNLQTSAAIPPKAAAVMRALALAHRAPTPTSHVGLRFFVLAAVFFFVVLSDQCSHEGPSSPEDRITTSTPYPPPASAIQTPPPVEPPPAPEPPADDHALQEAVDGVLHAMPSTDPEAIRSAMSNLRRIAARQPFVLSPAAGESSVNAYERGRNLLANDRAGALASFLRAIADDPDNAEAWYGYGVAVEDDDAAIGAFAVAELLMPVPSQAELMRADFSKDRLRRAGIDLRRYGRLEAKGRDVAARMSAQILAADIAGAAPPPSRSPHPVEEPPAPKTPPTPMDLDLTLQQVRLVALSLVAGEQDRWAKTVVDLQHAAANRQTPPGDYYSKRAFTQFVADFSEGRHTDEVRQAQLVAALKDELDAQPCNAEDAYELGWFDLLAGEASAARSAFVQAIACNPTRARAWYGFGVTALGDDGEAEGAMAMAETIYRDPRVARSMRDAFTPELLRRNGILPRRFAILQARALRLAEKERGDRIDPAVEAAANSELPPR